MRYGGGDSGLPVGVLFHFLRGHEVPFGILWRLVFTVRNLVHSTYSSSVFPARRSGITNLRNRTRRHVLEAALDCRLLQLLFYRRSLRGAGSAPVVPLFFGVVPNIPFM